MKNSKRVVLKSLKIAKHLSRETLAYTATVYVDGKKIGYAQNQGIGGPDELDFIRNKHGGLELVDCVYSNPSDGYQSKVDAFLDACRDDGIEAAYDREMEAFRKKNNLPRRDRDFNIEAALSVLVERTDLERTVRAVKQISCFGKQATSFYSVKGSYTPENAKRIREFHGDDIHIWNETKPEVLNPNGETRMNDTAKKWLDDHNSCDFRKHVDEIRELD